MPRLLQKSLFQSTSPARGTTCKYYFCYKGADISIHVPRTGDDKRFDVANTDDRNFNPRPPHGGRREVSFAFTVFIKFQSTSPRTGGTTKQTKSCLLVLTISIHVPRTGDDAASDTPTQANTHFNPRPPHGGRRLPPIWIPAAWQFQSTSPAWGTTPCRYIVIHRRVYFNPRPLHGGRPTSAVSVNGEYTISIHVPRMGDDLASMSPLTPNTVFQSTSPVRGTTKKMTMITEVFTISIHVPRAGDDLRGSAYYAFRLYFNPRPP